MRDSDQTKSKTILAKILSEENITVRVTQARTASFHLMTRTLTIPEMKADLPDFLFNMFVGHEVSHALYTPQAYAHVPRKHNLSGSMLNIVEDVRIEKLIQRDYPGLRREFVAAYKELLVRNFFGIRRQDVNTLCFLDRLNIHAKCGVDVGVTFSNKEQPFVNRAFATETFDEVVQLCIDMKAFLKANGGSATKPKMPIFKMLDDEEGDEEEGDDDGENYTPPDYSNENEEDGDAGLKPDQDKETGDDYSLDGNEKEDESEEEKKQSQSLTGGDGDTPDPFEDGVTDQSWNTNIDKLFEDADEAKILKQIDVPVVDYWNHIVSHQDIGMLLAAEFCCGEVEWEEKKGHYRTYGTRSVTFNFFEEKYRQALYDEYMLDNTPAISYMVKQFMARHAADELKRTSTAKTGKLNLKQVYSFLFNDDICLRNNVVQEGKSHSMMIYFDWSGSMIEHLIASLKQLFCLLDFCRKARIPFEVYAFQDRDEAFSFNVDAVNPTENGVNIGRQFTLLQLFTSKMTAIEHVMMQKNLLLFAKYLTNDIKELQFSGTPLNEAIIFALEMVPDFQKRTNTQIVNTVFVTDGASNPITVHVGGYDLSPRSDETIYIEDDYRNVVKVKGDQITEGLLELLEIRTKSNVVGFFLTMWSELLLEKISHHHKTAARAEFENNGSIVSVNSGYTEYYLINSEKLVPLPVKKTLTMINMENKRAVRNRVILNRFIELIAKQPK